MDDIEQYDTEFLPFGFPACEEEIENSIGGEPYKRLYLRDTPFDSEASKHYTYLIVGRRGAGKTAIAQSFRFSPRFKHPHHIFVEPKAYHSVLQEARQHIYRPEDLDLSRMKSIWERALWALIAASIDPINGPRPTMSGILRGIMSVLVIDDGNSRAQPDPADEAKLDDIKQRVLDSARTRPIILAIDTLERYSLADTNLLRAVAALIEFAKDFNSSYSRSNLHIKVLMSGEIFPHLEKHLLENPLKSIRSTVYLLWQPKPLLRLIAYRFHHYLQHNHIVGSRSIATPDWNNYEDVLEKVWHPYFGKYVTNPRGVKEHTFTYLLRHTQMRPRQLIVLCNQIASLAHADGTFPAIQNKHMVEGVEIGEITLAKEIINAFSPNFDNIESILASMRGCSLLLDHTELDKRSWGIKSEWRAQQELGKYSSEAFKAFLAELGIIGAVKKTTEQYIQADFEYSLRDRLEISPRDEFVIHPMFYKKLRVNRNTTRHVLPFSPDVLGEDL